MLQSEVRYVFDGREVIQERDQNSTTQVKYMRGLDLGGGIGGLLSRTVVGTGGGTYFYHYDGAGNVCALTDASQNTVAEYRYDAFGCQPLKNFTRRIVIAARKIACRAPRKSGGIVVIIARCGQK